ncbi:unnamed protein product [Caretta caretta]
MPFKSHLTVLVLMLCELHLIGSVNNHKIVGLDSVGKAGNKTTSLPTKTRPPPNSQLTSTTHPTSNDRNKTAADSQLTSTTHPTSKDKDKAVSTTRHNKDNALPTRESLKNSTLRSDKLITVEAQLLQSLQCLLFHH